MITLDHNVIKRSKKMSPKMIVMLTYNDQTVSNAIEVFDECKDLDVECWGFKDIGLPVEQMKQLIKNMKEAGKSTFLEVVSYDEETCLQAADLAIESEFDYFTGTTYFESVHEVLKKASMKYFPFCGKVSGNPSVLDGSIQEIIDGAKAMEEKGVDGFDLLAYRYTGDAEELARKLISVIKKPIVLAGSINSFERLDKVKEFNPWGFTIGSAFFDKKFVKDGSFKDQVEAVAKYLE